MTMKLNRGITHAEKEIKEGDIFYVYNDYYRKYFFGKILVDISWLTKQVEKDSALDFFSDCYLVAVYKEISDTPELHSREFIIPGSFIYKSSFKRRNRQGFDWTHYAYEAVDFHTLDFPEFFLNYDDGVYLVRGELKFRTELSRQQEEEYKIRGSKSGSIDYSSALLLQGYKAYSDRINYHDLRLLPELRKSIYDMIGEDAGMSYYNLALKYGKDTGRLFTDALPEEVQQVKPVETDQRTGFPKELLCGIAWSFRQQRYSSLAAFTDDLQAYNEEITGEYILDVWVDELKLIGSRILVQYEHWDDELEESREEKVFLQSDNGSYFTVSELIYKIHNHVCDKLVNDDNVFFEGLQLFERDDVNHPGTPYYFILQGS